MRLLLIEDHQLLGRALERALAEEGHTVEVACGPATGLRAMQTASYDAVIIDLVRCREHDLTALLRWRQAGQRTPVLALVAPDSASASQALSLGADGCVTVPFAVDELHVCLRSITRVRKADCPQRVCGG